ncbi:hypothetical protein [Salsipaludibacter albus]|uniref:hypothetical protein n=1 Tax=Salsipaludibacter albus TaxID=2849650 RepID=UPI001EE4522F|nr:hypothetical protein [Salsipaludibacter albus]MBY5161181.1 hypothetical protein [Salsipaludibacter albus]
MSATPTRSRRDHDDAVDPSTADDATAPDRTGPGSDPSSPTSTGHARDRGTLDRIARRVLLLRDTEPRALFDIQGSLLLSCIRCILTYVVIPIAVPLVSWAEVVATPLSLVLSLIATGMAVRSLRRVWQADWRYRWSYTVFIAVVVILLAVGIAFDVRALLP